MIVENERGNIGITSWKIPQIESSYTPPPLQTPLQTEAWKLANELESRGEKQINS